MEKAKCKQTDSQEQVSAEDVLHFCRLATH
jgi:hypothetical protein